MEGLEAAYGHTATWKYLKKNNVLNLRDLCRLDLKTLSNVPNIQLLKQIRTIAEVIKSGNRTLLSSVCSIYSLSGKEHMSLHLSKINIVTVKDLNEALANEIYQEEQLLRSRSIQCYYGHVVQSGSRVFCVVMPTLESEFCKSYPSHLFNGTPILMYSASLSVHRSPFEVVFRPVTAPPVSATDAKKIVGVDDIIKKYAAKLFHSHSNLVMLTSSLVLNNAGTEVVLQATLSCKGVVPEGETLLPKVLDGVKVRVVAGRYPHISNLSYKGLAAPIDGIVYAGSNISQGCRATAESDVKDFSTFGVCVRVVNQQTTAEYALTAGHGFDINDNDISVVQGNALSQLIFELLQSDDRVSAAGLKHEMSTAIDAEQALRIFTKYLALLENKTAKDLVPATEVVGNLVYASTTDQINSTVEAVATIDLAVIQIGVSDNTCLMLTPQNLRNPRANELPYKQELLIKAKLDTVLGTLSFCIKDILTPQQLRENFLSQYCKYELFGCGATSGMMIGHYAGVVAFRTTMGTNHAPHIGYRVNPIPNTYAADMGDSGTLCYTASSEGGLRCVGLITSWGIDSGYRQHFNCVIPIEDALQTFAHSQYPGVQVLWE